MQPVATKPLRLSAPAATLLASAVALSALAFVLDRFPPEEYTFYPRCPIYALTGWQCPGCGMTRALAALLHGRILEALHWNPLALFVPVAAGWVLLVSLRKSPPSPQLSPRQLTLALAALAAFTLLRNL